MTPHRLRRWTPHELDLLHQHYPTGGYRAVQAAGVQRSRHGIYDRARQEGLVEASTPPRVRVLAHKLAPRQPILRPTRPKRVTDALHALAETPGLTTSEYERKKAQILEGDHA